MFRNVLLLQRCHRSCPIRLCAKRESSETLGFGVADACTFVPHPLDCLGRFGDGSGTSTSSGNMCTLPGCRASKSAYLRGWSAPQKSTTRGASVCMSCLTRRRRRLDAEKARQRREEGVCPCLWSIGVHTFYKHCTATCLPMWTYMSFFWPTRCQP
jgi:hypothetical protein